MLTQQIAVHVQKPSRHVLFSGGAADEGGVVAVRHEADVLTVPLFGVDEAVFLCNAAHLRLGEATQRKQSVGKLVLRQHIEEITLVLAAVQSPLQQPAAAFFIICNLSVVAGGKAIAAHLPHLVQQRAEFDGAVADDAGVGGSARLVFRNEIAHHVFKKRGGEIIHVKGELQPPRHGTGVLGILAAAIVRRLCKAQIHAGELISLLLQQQCRHGAVHSAAHSYKHMAHTFPPCKKAAVPQWMTPLYHSRRFP